MTPHQMNQYLEANGVNVEGRTDQYYRLGLHPETEQPFVKAWYVDSVAAPTETDLSAYPAEAPVDLMEQWIADMQASDSTMTRIEEDIIDALDAATKQRLNQEVMDKYNAKKLLRESKPQ